MMRGFSQDPQDGLASIATDDCSKGTSCSAAAEVQAAHARAKQSIEPHAELLESSTCV